MLKSSKLYSWISALSLNHIFDLTFALKSSRSKSRPRYTHLSATRSSPFFKHKHHHLDHDISQRIRLTHYDIFIFYLKYFTIWHRPSKDNFCSPMLTMSKKGKSQEALCVGLADEASENDDCLDIDENISIEEDNSDQMSVSDADSDICVVFDNKEKQSQGAIEILIDDEDDATAASAVPVQARQPDYIPLSSSSIPASTSRPDYISLCTNDDPNLVPSQAKDRAVGRSQSSRPNRRPTSRWQIITDEEVESTRNKVEKCRSWDYTNLGAQMIQDEVLKQRFSETFTVMSYNVLAQSLLDGHPDLYTNHDARALTWEHRSQILFKELKMANPDILCLQEVQTSHMDTFYSTIKELGYGVLHKQRTGGKGDGVAIYYKESMFALKDSTNVEFYQPGIPILNRDNVAIVAKLRLKNDTRGRCIVVATTHLLFNPRRHDVKLAQMQILLAEVERFSYEGEERNGDFRYCPSIITGDMNFEPYTGVYDLLVTGMLNYEGLSSQNLSVTQYGRTLDRQLIPHYLEITDTCQHYSVLSERPGASSFEDQQKNIKLFSSESRSSRNKKKNQFRSFDEYVKEMIRRGCINNFTPNPNGLDSPPPSSDPELQERCGTGQLSHGLSLRSVYNHGHPGTDRAEVTTFQGWWTTVDYIFYGCKYSPNLGKVIEGDLKLVSRLRLPRANQATSIGPIPNAAVPSDHYPIAAVFLLK